MKCNTCQTETNRIIQIKGVDRCSNCTQMSEAAGARIDGLLTRNRNRADSLKFEGDMITPHSYNKARRDIDVNPDFIKLYPDKAKDVYTEEKMVGAGLPKLAEYSKELDKRQKEYKEKTSQAEFQGVGQEASKIKEIVV